MTIELSRRHMLMATGASSFAATGFALGAKAQIAAALPPPPTPDLWAKADAVQNISLSPDGLRICYMTEKDAEKYLFSFDLTTQKAQSFKLGKAVIDEISWLDGTHVLVTTLVPVREVRPGEGWRYTKGQTMIASVYNLAAGTQNVLFSKVQFFQSVVTGTPKRITYEGKVQVVAASFKGEMGNDFTYLYRFDLDGGKSYAMDQGEAVLYWLLSPEGEMIARASYYWQTRIWTADYRKNGAWKEVYRTTVRTYSPAILGFGEDGKDLIMSVPSDGEINDICRLSPEGVLSAPLVERDSLRRPYFNKYTRRLLGYTWNDGWTQYEFADPAMKTVAAKAAKAVDGYRMLISDYAEDPNKSVIYSQGDDDAGSYYYIDFSTGKTFEIGKSYPDIAAEWISHKTLIRYKAKDGLEIEAYLSLPPNKPAKDLPLVVYPHDGPRGITGVAVNWVVQALTSSGYAVLQPNYRGSNANGQAFIEAGNGEWAGKILTDISDGVAFVVAQGLIDAKRVSIFGSGGYAGYAALAGVSLQSGIYNCAIDAAGITDVKLYRQTEIGDDKSPYYQYFMRLVGEKTDLDAISPLRNIDKIKVPVMIIQAEEDTEVSYHQQSVKMASALKAAGKTVFMPEFKAEQNWEIVEASRTEYINHIIGFLKKHNPA